MPDDAASVAKTGSALLEPGRNCWRIERARRAALVVDAADYFRLARQAMLNARCQILLMGWDLDTRIKLVDEAEEGEGPAHLGPFISWLAKRRPDLRIYILAWDGAAYSLLGRGTTLARMAVWRLLSRRITLIANPALDLVDEPARDASLPMPSELDWKRELRRRR